MGSTATPNYPQPATVHTVAFVDGQNLFHCAKTAFGYTYPNYDPKRLAETICAAEGWKLTQVRFYTGVPPKDRDPHWHEFWAKKSTSMSRKGVHMITRPLRYSEELLTDGTFAYVPREKGIDVRIAIDVISLADKKNFDAALIFSQDQDLAEVVPEIRAIASRQKRWIKLASAYPAGEGATNPRGINNTDWILIDRHLYDSCLDPNRYSS